MPRPTHLALTAIVLAALTVAAACGDDDDGTGDDSGDEATSAEGRDDRRPDHEHR